MKKLCFFILVLFSQINFAKGITTISPGIKLGYAFGESGGFIFGAELSFMIDENSYKEKNIYGGVLSIEKLNNEYRVHIGAQINFNQYDNAFSFLGLEIGPTLFLTKNRENFGFSITPYFGAFIIPYYRLIVIPKILLQHEVGSFLKLHIPPAGAYRIG